MICFVRVNNWTICLD